MTNYLWGVATPFLLALAALLVIYGPGLLRAVLGSHHVRHTKQALRLLSRKEQQKLLDFWRAPSRYTEGGQPLSNAYTKREDIYGSEQVLTSGDISAFTHYGPLLPRFLKWGYYPLLAAGIPQIAEETRITEREQETRRSQAQSARKEEAAAREAAAAATKARITELLGPKHTSATFIHYPSGSLTPGLDTVLYLPEASEHEPDPDRPGVLVKSPALAVHIKTDFGTAAHAYMTGDGQYHGLALERRLRAAHPEIYTPTHSPIKTPSGGSQNK